MHAQSYFSISAIFFGLLTIAVAFLSGIMGKLVLQIALSTFGIIGGPLAGIISLGLFVPIANTWVRYISS